MYLVPLIVTACSAARPVIPDRQVKMSEDYIFEILDGEWITDDECGKIVFDCSGDEKKVTRYEMTDNSEWVVTGNCGILRLDYPEGEDTVVKFKIVSAGDDGIDNEYTLDTEKETLKQKETSFYSRQLHKELMKAPPHGGVFHNPEDHQFPHLMP